MARPEIPRLLVCKACQNEWRAREVVLCPKCHSPEVKSLCGAKTEGGGLCRLPSAHGQPRCAKKHNANASAKAAARAGRSSGWSNRTFANAVIRAASSPELRDMTHDHAAIQRLLDDAVDTASAGAGGVAAWRRLERLIALVDFDDPDRLVEVVEKIKALIKAERLRSSALLDVDMLAKRRAEMLEAESNIQYKAKAFIPILDLQVALAVLVGAIWQIAPEAAPELGKAIRLQFPGVNTLAALAPEGN